MGFIRVANEAMCRPIRALTQSRGYDTSKHVLACFGGAGGQHACSIARDLGMSKIVIHKYAGILSAYGMALADVVCEAQEPCGLEYSLANVETIRSRLNALALQCRTNLQNQGFDDDHILIEPFLHLRYDATDSALMCTPSLDASSVADLSVNIPDYGDFYASFLNRYKTEFGFVIRGRKVIVDDIRVRGSGKSNTPQEEDIERGKGTPKIVNRVKTYFDGIGLTDVDVILSTDLSAGHILRGPLILIDKLSTILIEPNCTAEITRKGDLIINVELDSKLVKCVDESLDAVQLSIFSHRFMSIAEQMGRILQRTSISTNIKERLDFSCALFGPDGGLVSNAPHIPVHLGETLKKSIIIIKKLNKCKCLGAMQETVQYQLKVRGASLKVGDVLLSNHPQAGNAKPIAIVFSRIQFLHFSILRWQSFAGYDSNHTGFL